MRLWRVRRDRLARRRNYAYNASGTALTLRPKWRPPKKTGLTRSPLKHQIDALHHRVLLCAGGDAIRSGRRSALRLGFTLRRLSFAGSGSSPVVTSGARAKRTAISADSLDRSRSMAETTFCARPNLPRQIHLSEAPLLTEARHPLARCLAAEINRGGFSAETRGTRNPV
jgi:hypothetical protein